MKIAKLTSCVALAAVVAASLAFLHVARADDSPKANPFLTTLSSAPLAELPAKSAALVLQSDAKQQIQTTIDVVRAAVGLNPAAAPVIVGSIAQSTPDMAATAAGTAVGLVPNQSGAIARAAAAAAPKQAGKIVEAICRVVPGNYVEVAENVSEIVPGAAREILAGVVTALPQLKEPINKILVSEKDAVPSVSGVLNQVKDTVPVGRSALPAGNPVSSAAVSPVILPPYVPPPASPVNYGSASGGQVPPGGRTPPPP